MTVLRMMFGMMSAATTVYQPTIFSTDSPSDWSITDGGHTALNTLGGNNLWRKVRAIAPKTTGSHYIEILVVSVSSAAVAIGLAPSGTSTVSAEGGDDNAGFGGRMQYYNDGRKRANGTYDLYGATYGPGDRIGIGYDADTGTITAYKNGTSQGVMYSSVPDNMEPHLAVYASPDGCFSLPEALYLPSGYTLWAP